jgi:hypothetical protein
MSVSRSENGWEVWSVFSLLYRKFTTVPLANYSYFHAVCQLTFVVILGRINLVHVPLAHFLFGRFPEYKAATLAHFFFFRQTTKNFLNDVLQFISILPTGMQVNCYAKNGKNCVLDLWISTFILCILRMPDSFASQRLSSSPQKPIRWGRLSQHTISCIPSCCLEHRDIILAVSLIPPPQQYWISPKIAM